MRACGLMWYLHLVAEAGVLAVAYRDATTEIMVGEREQAAGSSG